MKRKKRISPISRKPHKKAERECFALIQEVVALRDNRTCVLCGKPANGGGHHVIKRRYRNVAFDPRNVYSLCLECHGMDDKYPETLKLNLIRHMGLDNYRAIWTLAQEVSNIDYTELAEELRAMITEYKGG